MTDYVGKQLGNYRVIQLLGRGGFADVYLGEHQHISTQVAIKVLHTRVSQDVLESMRAEARIVASLKHPHIVRIHDFGVENETPFMVMDYAPYGTLRQRHPRGSTVPLPQVVSYVKQLASALQFAHDQKVVHRDLKPENILLEQEGHLLLSDFGIAVVAHSSQSLSAQLEAGTISYMAPEQIQGKARKASDQYALGIMAYEWLSGACPFQGSYWEIMSNHLHAPPPPLRDKLPLLPLDVEQAILAALAKDPHQRHPTVQDFADTLEKARTKPHIGETLCIYTRHSGTVNAVSWSPDGTRIASAGDDERVLLWDTDTGKTHYTLDCYYDCSDDKGHEDEYGDVDVLDVAWSPDGTRIASADFVARVIIWNAANGREVLTYDRHWPGTPDNPVWSLSWSPDSKLIASLGTDMQIWDAATGELLLRGGEGSGWGIAWSPDGSKLACCGPEHTIAVHTFQDGSLTPLAVFNGHTDFILAIAWSPDGTRIVSAGDEAVVYMWESTTGQLQMTYHEHDDDTLVIDEDEGEATSVIVHALAWSPDGTRIASGGSDGTIHIWDARTGQHIFSYTEHEFVISDVAWSPDGARIASASQDETVHVWQAV